MPNDWFSENTPGGGDWFDDNSPDSITPQSMNAKSLQQSRITSLPEPKPGFVSRLGETTGLTSGPDAVTDAASQINQIREHPIDSLVQGTKQLAKAPAQLAYGAMVHPLDTSEALMPANRAISDARSGQYGAAAGDILGGIGNVYALGKGLQQVPEAANKMASVANRAGVPSGPSSETIARTLRNPATGSLKPSVRAASTVGGAVVGGLTGMAGAHEYGAMGGAFLGGRYAPAMVDALTPNLSDADLFQGRVDRGVRNAQISQAVKDRIPPPETITPYGPTRVNPEQIEQMNPPLTPMGPTRVNPSDIQGATPTPQVATSMESATVADPSFSGSEGRAATWTNQDVIRIAATGNREAIQQKILRGLPLSQGERYIMGDPSYGRAVYNPRETTTFEPENMPIRNMQKNPISSRQRIQKP